MATVEQTTTAERPREQLRGSYIDRDAPDYDRARAVYKAMIDKRPSAIVRYFDAADVISAGRYARGQDLRVAGRSGAHNGAGLGTPYSMDGAYVNFMMDEGQERVQATYGATRN
jgi:hypothetical protein